MQIFISIHIFPRWTYKAFIVLGGVLEKSKVISIPLIYKKGRNKNSSPVNNPISYEKPATKITKREPRKFSAPDQLPPETN